MATTTNNAVVYMGERNIQIQDRPMPKCDIDQVLVKVICTGICGSDVHNYCDPKTHPGLILGHESAGEIIEVGANVKGRHVGQRVAIEPAFVCRRCEFCCKGLQNVCAAMKYGGMDKTDGTLSQYFACEPEMAVPFPDHLPWEEAGCIQPMAIAVQLARQANLRPHQTVAVFGCGPLGLMIMALAKAYGASKIVAFDIEESRVDFAKTYAADVGIVSPMNTSGKEPLGFAKEFINPLLSEYDLGYGVDLAIDASGAESCMQMAVIITKPYGTYIQAGLGKQLCSVPMWLITAKGLTVKGTVRYSQGCFADAIDLLARKKVDIAPLISSKYPLTKAAEALEAQRAKEGIKIVIMNQE
ncbi:hypothetical protein BP6252_05993 [Coleophoma cylindrospora]|uniref:D-xylulose reductase n=1 Tax=Coleophoma cylindrospora TaxID=1849047 RepID=A0A3D8RM28_9HELO|nr:hypothetical protein BP6252_05993 [Coleophoma cylindrospora]